MRRSLAGHARDRLERVEQQALAKRWLAEQCARLGIPEQPTYVTPDVTALRLRADKAERNATFWYRTAMVLVVVLLIVVAGS